MHNLHSISLLLISALVLFSPLQEGGTTHPAQMIIRLLILTWLGFVLAAGMRRDGSSSVLAMRYVVLGFVGLALVATLLSPYSHPSRQWLIMIAGYATLFYLLVSFVDRWEHIRTLTVLIVVMGVGEAGWAIMQGLAWDVVRPSGTFFNPNFLGGYLTVTWTILLSIAIYGYRQVSAFSRPWIAPILWWMGLVYGFGRPVPCDAVDPVSRGHDRMACWDGFRVDGTLWMEISRWLCCGSCVARALCPDADS